MFAVVESGGNQFKVAEGDVVKVELLKAEAGDVVELPVMMLGGDNVSVGTPTVVGASVKAEVIKHFKGEKIRILRFKAKNNSRVRKGHRQTYTELKIKEILV